MRIWVMLATLALVAIANGDDDTGKPEVTTCLGRVRGSVMTSRLGRPFSAFRGIRYAEAPTGERRFAPAVPAEPWRRDDVFDASQEGPSCPQPRGALQSEDCLRVNVYTAKLPAQNSSDAVGRPVFVFFHPGGYYGFSGQSLVEGPHYLMDQDIVLVLANNRLASLGFLSTGDAHAPGNLGLKDQVEALRWVRRNIASFGGDPDRVTICGYSSGARSVSLHLLSPMTRGLFHRAIVMSGSVIPQTPLPNDQRHLAKKQAQLVGCPSDTSADIVRCLRTKNATEISDTLSKFFEWNGAPIAVWTPVVEPEIPGVERYLTAQPADLIRQGKFHRVPVITGVTKNEFSGIVVFITEQVKKGNTSTLDDLNANWEKIAPILFLYERGTPRSRRISREIRKFYFNGGLITLDNIDALGQAYADGVVGFPVNRFAKLMSQASSLPVYYYQFTYQGSLSFTTWTDTKKPYGVVHHDDLLYLFHMRRFPVFGNNAPENRIVERQTSMWANFAEIGEPVPRDDEKFANVTWTPFTVENNAYLEMGDELVMKTNLFSERMNLWHRLFPLRPMAGTNIK